MTFRHFWVLTDSSLFLPTKKARSDFSLLPIHIGMCSIRFPDTFNICRFDKFSSPSIFTILLFEMSSSFSLRSLSRRSIFSMMLLLRINTWSRFIRSKFSIYWSIKQRKTMTTNNSKTGLSNLLWNIYNGTQSSYGLVLCEGTMDTEKFHLPHVSSSGSISPAHVSSSGSISPAHVSSSGSISPAPHV